MREKLIIATFSVMTFCLPVCLYNMCKHCKRLLLKQTAPDDRIDRKNHSNDDFFVRSLFVQFGNAFLRLIFGLCLVFSLEIKASVVVVVAFLGSTRRKTVK